MPKLNFITPFFIVSNLKDAISFYVDKLGFEVWYTGPDENPYWAMIGCGSVSIMLKVIADDIKAIPNPTRHEWAPWDAYISVDDPDTLYEEYSDRGVTSINRFMITAITCAGLKWPTPTVMFCFLEDQKRDKVIEMYKDNLKIRGMSPQFVVADLERSLNFYIHELGFEIDFRYEDFYAGIIKDGFTLHIKLGYASVEKNAFKAENEHLDLCFAVTDIDRLYEAIEKQNVNITQPLREMPYGREFYIADPDGYILSFLE